MLAACHDAAATPLMIFFAACDVRHAMIYDAAALRYMMMLCCLPP